MLWKGIRYAMLRGMNAEMSTAMPPYDPLWRWLALLVVLLIAAVAVVLVIV